MLNPSNEIENKIMKQKGKNADKTKSEPFVSYQDSISLHITFQGKRLTNYILIKLTLCERKITNCCTFLNVQSTYAAVALHRTVPQMGGYDDHQHRIAYGKFYETTFHVSCGKWRYNTHLYCNSIRSNIKTKPFVASHATPVGSKLKEFKELSAMPSAHREEVSAC